jgi:hypothetical protein
LRQSIAICRSRTRSWKWPTLFGLYVSSASQRAACWRAKLAGLIDRGTIDTGNRSAPLCEIELELKHGSIADVFNLACELTRVLPARLAA